MWIFTSNEFLSIVRHRTKPDHFMVRFRTVEQAEQCTLKGTVTVTPTADYIARKVVHEADLKDWMLQQLTDLQYDNYKNSTHDTPMHDAPLMDVWQSMHNFQTVTEYGDQAYKQHPSSAFWADYHIEGDDTHFCEDCWTRHKLDDECAVFGQKGDEEDE